MVEYMWRRKFLSGEGCDCEDFVCIEKRMAEEFDNLDKNPALIDIVDKVLQSRTAQKVIKIT